MKSVTHQTTLHLSFKIKCCVDRLRSTPINRHFQSRSALGKSAKERCPQNRYRDLNPHSPKDALSSGAAFEIQIIAISSLPWIGESRPIPLGNAGAPFSGA